MKAVALIIGCVFLLVSGTCLLSQTTPNEKLTHRVELNVSGDNSIKEEVSSYIMRELRSLGDVEAVNNNPDLRIRVMVLQLTAVNGAPRGFAISVLATTPVVLNTFKDLFPNVDPKALKFLEDGVGHSEFFEGQFVLTGGSDELSKLCKQVAAKIDADYLEPMRKVWNEFQRHQKDH